MGARDLLLFGNVSQPPFCNNLFPPLRALQKLYRVKLVEPARHAGFVSTGGARPALIPDAAVIENTDPPPGVVVCLGGALAFSDAGLRMFPKETALAAFALSDPQGIEASIDDRAAVRPLLHAGSADAPGLCRAGHRRPALRSRDRCGALPAAARGARLRRSLLREVDAVSQRPAFGSGAALPRPRPCLRGRDPVERARAPPAGHAGRPLRRTQPRAPGPGDGSRRRRAGEVPRHVSHHAARFLRGVLRRALADRVLGGGARLLRARRRDRDLRGKRRRRRRGRARARRRARPGSPSGQRARQRALRDHTWDRRAEAFLMDVNRWRPTPSQRRAR